MALKKKLHAVQKITIKDKGKMFELSDILSEIRAVKERPEYMTLLSFYDTSMGINPAVTTLPPNLQYEWRDRAASYKSIHGVTFPPFTHFCDSVHDMAELFNDPSFDFDMNSSSTNGTPQKSTRVSVAKTAMSSVNSTENGPALCIIHKTNHTLDECRAFRHKSPEDRKTLLKQNGICFRCCVAKHLRKNCQAKIQCTKCNETTYSTVMHMFRVDTVKTTRPAFGGDGVVAHSGEQSQPSSSREVSSNCTEICKCGPAKSCAKIVLSRSSHVNNLNKQLKVYAIIYDQRNSMQS